MPFLPPNQQRQSTEGTQIPLTKQKTVNFSANFQRVLSSQPLSTKENKPITRKANTKHSNA